MKVTGVRVPSLAPFLEVAMENMEWYVKEFHLPATEEQLIAGRYLESRGFRFLCEFGYGNAVKKADILFANECEILKAFGEVQ